MDNGVGVLEEVRTENWKAAWASPGSSHAAQVRRWPRADVPRVPRQEERAQNEERQRFFDQLSSFNQQYDVAINRSPARPHARTHAGALLHPRPGAGALLPPGAALAGLARTVSGDACAPRSRVRAHVMCSAVLRTARRCMTCSSRTCSSRRNSHLRAPRSCRAPIMGGHKLDLHALFTIVLENQV